MLELVDITKRFGTVLANDRVNIAVAPGTIHAIVGENGAGKSTAMRIAYGFYTADSGQILVDGRPRDIRTPHDAIALGIGMVHQHFMLIPPMTVVENIVLGAEPGRAMALDRARAADEIRQLSTEFTLAVDPHAAVDTLSVGQQQRVELLKALYRRARMLILDEPTAVLTPQDVHEFFAVLRRMREQGRTVIIITHKLSEVLAISDDITVMRDGRVVGRLKTAETNTAEMARLMVGRDVLLRVAKAPARPGEVRLQVRNLSVRAPGGGGRVKGVSFDVRAGEVVGVAGVEGNGQTELIEALAGLVPAAHVSGAITFAGHDITRLDARRRRELGIAHVPEDRHRRGLLLESSLLENAILGVHYRPPAVSRAGSVLLNRAGIQQRTEQVIRDFDVRPPRPALPARALSGGNQQKLIIGREFELPPTLLLVSAELEEVMALSDRLLVLHDGRVAGEVDPARSSAEEIGLLMTGSTRDAA